MEKKRKEDVLRELWIKLEEEKVEVKVEQIERKVLSALKREDYITIKNRKVFLTEKGKRKGMEMVRLHRLTERLLSDILEMSEELYEKATCSVEHAITPELEEAICTLLGHPPICPHGKLIPRGKCCIKNQDKIERIIYNLTQLHPGDFGRISYIYSTNPALISRMISLGIAPGRKIKLLRKFPSYIIQIGNTQIAIDEELAKNINVIKALNHKSEA